MDKLNLMWAWIQANPVVFTAIAVYVIANLMPRPHPEKMTGWKRTFWSIVDGLCLLTAAKVPGNLKWLLANSPPLRAETHVVDKAGESSVADGPDEEEEEEVEQPLSEDSESKKVEK
jgi:hypothetical protein